VRVDRTSEAFHILGRVIAALIVGPILTMIEFWVAVFLRWKWLLLAVMGPAAAVQRWLEKYCASSAQSGGHMPDFSFVVEFNAVINIGAVLILLFYYPNLLSGFFTPRREQQ
jgi:hypothetical protein